MPTERESKTRNLAKLKPWPPSECRRWVGSDMRFYEHGEMMKAALLDVEAAEKRARADERIRVLEEVRKLLDEMRPLPASEYVGVCVIDQDRAINAVASLAAQPGEG